MYDDEYPNLNEYFLAWDDWDRSQLQTAKIQATAKGDKVWEKVLNSVIKYGDPILTILTKNGVIPNKNIQSLVKAQYDQQALAQLLAANGGSLDKAPSQITDRSANTIFGLNTSTLILIAAAILLFFVMQNSNSSSKK